MRIPFFSDLFVFLVSFLKLIRVYLRKVFGASARRVSADVANYDPETGISISQLTKRAQELPPVSQKLPDPPPVMKFDGFDYDSRTGTIRMGAVNSTEKGRIGASNSGQ